MISSTLQHIGCAYGLAHDCCLASHGDVRWLEWIGSHDPWDGRAQGTPTSLIYTSGTTGRPKGVRRQALSPEQRAAFASVAQQTLGLTGGSRTVIAAPMYHSAPNATAMFALQIGATAVLQPRFDAEELLRLIDRYEITAVQLVPTMFVQLLNLPAETRLRYDLSSLAHVCHTAAPCPPDVKRRMIQWWGPVIYEFYGSTEMGAVTSAPARNGSRTRARSGARSTAPRSRFLILTGTAPRRRRRRHPFPTPRHFRIQLPRQGGDSRPGWLYCQLRGRRLPGRGRISLRLRSQNRSRHSRWHERLSGGDRGCTRWDAGGGRLCGVRGPRRPAGRGSRGCDSADSRKHRRAR